MDSVQMLNETIEDLNVQKVVGGMFVYWPPLLKAMVGATQSLQEALGEERARLMLVRCIQAGTKAAKAADDFSNPNYPACMMEAMVNAFCHEAVKAAPEGQMDTLKYAFGSVGCPAAPVCCHRSVGCIHRIITAALDTPRKK